VTTETEGLDLTKYAFPKVDKVNMVFPTYSTDPALLKEAERRGFDRNTPYNKLFNDLFFGGGKVTFKQDVPEPFRTEAWAYCRALMGSFSPKHEHKEAVCAMLMSELLEPKLEPKEKAA
jgi:hypothetical protein